VVDRFVDIVTESDTAFESAVTAAPSADEIKTDCDASRLTAAELSAASVTATEAT